MKPKQIFLQLSIFIFFITFFFSEIQCDLPVHCLAKTIAGKWRFMMDTSTHDSQPSCGHENPDRNTDHISSRFKESIKKHSEMRLSLQLPDIITHNSKHPGDRWTMVYDEGFEVFTQNRTLFAFSKYNTIDNKVPTDTDDEQSAGYKSQCNETFLGWYQDHANNNKWGCFYAFKEDNGEQQQGETSVAESQLFKKTSNDNKIVERRDLIEKNNNNIVQDKNNKKFNFMQDGPVLEKENVKQVIKDMDSLEKLEYDDLSLLDRFKQNLPLYQLPHPDIIPDDSSKSEKNALKEDTDLFFEPDLSFIQTINSDKLNSPWKARVHNHFKGKTHSEMKKLIGMTRFKEVKLQQHLNILNQNQESDKSDNQFKNDDYQNALSQDASLSFLQIQNTDKKKIRFLGLDKSKNVLRQNLQFERFLEDNNEDICNGVLPNGLPKCLDWRNKDGKNYDTPIKRQGDCGSCYALATLSALESRIRIKSQLKHQPFLSIAGAVSCSNYNQGCNGGYPYLVGKSGKEIGFFEENCSPYGESDKICQKKCFDQKLWKVKDYGYVGKKYYGSTNEEDMMKEIYHNGPIVVAINAATDLYYYSSGVFVSNPSNPLKESNGRDDMRSWEFTNHALTCIGWGETNHEGHKLKYWILKNSWGDDWGDKGYFKMLRGKNLGSVENQAVFTSPDF